jgi:tRNA threonylcarbamoyladenosine biosynthesis protein TsaB
VNPLILAVDTTHEWGSLALARGDELIEEVLLHAPTGFAHILYEHLGRLLGRHALQPAAIDLYAAAAGPGSFTGVRIGLACVKGLAEALGKPAAAISNLQTLSTFGTGPLRAVVMDARRGEVYGAVYDDAAMLVAPETVALMETWLESLPRSGIEFICGSPELAAALAPRAPAITAPPALAGAIARLAHREPAAQDANYVRRSDAEHFWKE